MDKAQAQIIHTLAQDLTAAGFAVTESHRDISR